MTEDRQGRHSVSRWLLVVVALVVGGCDRGPEVSVYTPIAELEFADPLLAHCVQSAAERYGWPTAGQVEMLHCSSADPTGIVALDGIEALVNLQDLNLSHNRIRDVSPLLGLKKLARLDLGFNDIELVEALPRSLHIDLNHNRLSDLDWTASTPTVRTLLVEYNDVVDLRPLSGLEWLTELRASGNRITSLSGLEGAARLKYLDVSDNAIESLQPLSGLALLTQLQLSGNRIVDVGPLAGLKTLRDLDLSSNRIRDVAPLGALADLKVLDLSGNPVASIVPLLSLAELHEFDVQNMPDLPCAQVRRAFETFGERVVTADARCAGDAELGSGAP